MTTSCDHHNISTYSIVQSNRNKLQRQLGKFPLLLSLLLPVQAYSTGRRSIFTAWQHAICQSISNARACLPYEPIIHGSAGGITSRLLLLLSWLPLLPLPLHCTAAASRPACWLLLWLAA